MSKSISNTDDIIDSRDVNARINELQLLCEDIDADERKELEELLSLAEQGERFGDWEDGVCLVRESYFETYAQEFAEDIGAVISGVAWPCNCIDWRQAALELQQGYTPISFGEVTYYGR